MNMKGKRTDLEIQAEIITRLIKWELWADIAKDLWVHESTVSRIKDWKLQEVARSSDIIADIIENDMESVKEMSELTKMFMKQIKKSALDEWIDKAELAVANTTAESALKRSQLLQGKATERIAIEDLSSLSPKQLEEERNKLL